MRKTNKLFDRLPLFVATAVMGIFSVQTIITNIITSSETATALSITSITSNIGPTSGGELVTITGDFGIPDIPLDIVQITSGNSHIVALDRDGQIWAWGGGILGDGGTSSGSSVPVRVDMTGVLAGRTIVYISAGTGHTLALDSEGNVFAWGQGSVGQLGNNASTNSNIPVEVDMTGVLYGRTIIQVAAGSFASFALDSDGNIFSWGWGNQHGLLGNGTTHTVSNVPVAVVTSGALAGRTITQISSSGDHALALDSEGNIFAWGRGWEGQFGNGTSGTSNISSVPVAVDMTGILAGRTIVEIVGGAQDSFAIDSEGNVFAWGSNSQGQLGDGTNINQTLPTAVDMTGVLSGRNVVQLTIARGMNTTTTVDSEGNVFAWGWNGSGQLGNGTIGGSSNIPTMVDSSGVLAGRKIVQITSGHSHTLALDSKGNVFAWGSNPQGQFGNGTNTGSNVPILITNFGASANPIEYITLGDLPCTNITVINPNTVTCTTPAHQAGIVDVTVRTLHGSVTLYQSYTFIDLPDVPNTGHGRTEEN